MNNEKGITLIEVVVSMGILGMLSILFVTMMGTSSRIQSESMKMTKGSMAAASSLEQNSSGTGTSDTFKIKFSGETEWEVSGQMVKETKDGVTYNLFVPNN